MKFLVDTHTFLWLATEPEKLPVRAREICTTEDLFLSVASVWEMGIKCELGRLPLPSPPREYIAAQIRRGNISMLPIHYRHALAAAGLPTLHKDPFDRMLAAQCLEENLSCVTKDQSIAAYGVPTVWA